MEDKDKKEEMAQMTFTVVLPKYIVDKLQDLREILKIDEDVNKGIIKTLHRIYANNVLIEDFTPKPESYDFQVFDRLPKSKSFLVRESIMKYESKYGKVMNLDDLFKQFASEKMIREDFDKIIDSLIKEGFGFRPKKNYFQKI